MKWFVENNWRKKHKKKNDSTLGVTMFKISHKSTWLSFCDNFIVFQSRLEMAWIFSTLYRWKNNIKDLHKIWIFLIGLIYVDIDTLWINQQIYIYELWAKICLWAEEFQSKLSLPSAKARYDAAYKLHFVTRRLRCVFLFIFSRKIFPAWSSLYSLPS